LGRLHLCSGRQRPIKSLSIPEESKRRSSWGASEGSRKALDSISSGPGISEEQTRRDGGTNEAFYIYNSAQFLFYSNSYLKAKISEESINQVKEVFSRIPRPTPERSRGRIESVDTAWQVRPDIVEDAIYEWIQQAYPSENLMFNRTGWPDFVLEFADGGTIGFDIVMPRSAQSIALRLRDVFYRASHELNQANFAHVEIFVIVPEGERMALVLKILKSGNLPKVENLTVTVGTVEEDGATGRPIFRPQDSLSGNLID
jgi:hypothetical protein